MTRSLTPLVLVALTLGALALLATPAAQAGSCSATQQCSGGGSVSCTGSSSCLVGSNYVECDGVRTSCQTTCSISLDCGCPSSDSVRWQISCQATSSGQNCSTGFQSVTCGSTTVTCGDCRNNPSAPGCTATDLCQSFQCNQGAFCSSDADCGFGFCDFTNRCQCQLQ